MILDSGEQSVLPQEGDAALIPPGRFELTELPRPRFTRGETLFYFFNQRAVADLVDGREGLDEVVARITLPAFTFYPGRRLGTLLDTGLAAGTLELNNLRGLLTGMLHRGSALAHNFLKHHYFAGHFNLCVWLEQQCHGKENATAIAQRYQGGARAFRRDCVLYLGMPASQWILRRKIEIAQAWLRSSDCSVQEVAARLGFDDLRMFRG